MKNESSNLKNHRNAQGKTMSSKYYLGFSTNSKFMIKYNLFQLAAVAEEIILQNSKKSSKNPSIRDF